MIAYGASYKRVENKQLKTRAKANPKASKALIVVLPKQRSDYGQNDYGVKL
ncbi:MAG: hypothetical protein JWN26_820 [Candidatus Saccharibacteria bacterium]|nr:hypothetical protein [Candidatus Saccharibacteria bacterium]